MVRVLIRVVRRVLWYAFIALAFVIAVFGVAGGAALAGPPSP